MDLPPETADRVLEFARRFDEKSFMPAFGRTAAAKWLRTLRWRDWWEQDRSRPHSR